MNEVARAARLSRRELLIYSAVHAGILGGGAVWAAVRYRQESLRRRLPPLQARPWAIVPRYDEPPVIDLPSLRMLLERLELRDQGASLKINHVDHALRFLGKDHRPKHQGALSGRQMLALLTDHREFVRRYGPGTPPLLERSDWGVRVRYASQGVAVSSHRDHTAATLAEVGLPLEFELHTPQGPATMADLVRHVLLSFELDQQEYEWSTLVAACYLAPQRQWFNHAGRKLSFDLLAPRIMRQRMPQGVCYGNHRLFSLAALLQLDQQHELLSRPVRAAAVRYLQGMSRVLVRHQHALGFWNGNWPYRAPQSVRPATTGTTDRLPDRILATGHALEWLAIAPEEVLPPRDVVVRAAAWLRETILGLETDQITQWYTFLSHAGRALAMWRGRYPEQLQPASPPRETPSGPWQPEEKRHEKPRSE